MSNRWYSGGVDCERRRNVYDKKPQRFAKDNRTAHLTARSDKSVAYVTNNKRLYSTFGVVEANYWQTRGIARRLCDSRATCRTARSESEWCKVHITVMSCCSKLLPDVCQAADTTDTFKRRLDKFWQHQDHGLFGKMSITSDCRKISCIKLYGKMHHSHAEMTTWPKVKTGS